MTGESQAKGRYPFERMGSIISSSSDYKKSTMIADLEKWLDTDAPNLRNSILYVVCGYHPSHPSELQLLIGTHES